MTPEQHDAPSSSSASSLRSVEVSRTAPGRYEATNVRGGRLTMGTGEDDTFTPVELLLAAIGGCTSVDVDVLTSRRSEPTRFVVDVAAEKLADGDGHHLGPVTITFDIAFPDGAQGDAARAALPRAVEQSHDRLCTVSRTVALPTPVRSVIAPQED